MIRSLLRSTRGRLVLLQVAALAVASAVTAGAVFELVTVPLRNQLDQALFDQWSAVANALDVIDGRPVYPPGRLPTISAETRQPVEADVYTASGLLVQTEAQSLGPAYLGQLAATVLRSGGSVGPLEVRDASGGRRRLYAAAQPLGEGPSAPRAAVIVSLSAADLDALTSRLLAALVVGCLLVVGIGGGLAWLLVSRTLRPVGAIAAAAREIGDRELHRRVTAPAYDDEVGELEATFNGMLERLERSFESLRRFTADASHELRSPLALMRTEVDVALTRERSPAEYQRVLHRVTRELEHLARVADVLLLLAQADAGSLVPDRTEIDVADLVEETAVRWQRTAAERGIELVAEAPTTGRLVADPHLLRRVLDNLLDNAVRHSPELGRVVLSARQEGGTWQIDVSDQGAGVPPELRERIFERFARGDPARSRHSGGAGLGLALSAAVAHSHGGTLELVEDGSPGATFRLRLPTDEFRAARRSIPT